MKIFKPIVFANYFFLPAYFATWIYVSKESISFYEWICSLGLSYIIITFGVAFTFHRIFCHNAAQISSLIRFFGFLFGTLSNTGSPVTWYINHSLHHKHSDTIQDPHYSVKNFWKIIFGFFVSEADQSYNPELIPLLKKVRQDSMAIFFHNYYYLILFTYFLILIVAGGSRWLILFGLLPMSLGFFSVSLLNYFNHINVGYKNYLVADNSNNFWPLFFINFGENWHNNHHAFPKAQSNRKKWWEFDFIYLYFFLFEIKK